MRPFAIGRVGALLVVVTIIALVTAVVFHVVLAQNQMELDHLNGQITNEQRVYEQRRLDTATLASPQNVIQQAERLGLIQPGDSTTTLYVPERATAQDRRRIDRQHHRRLVEDEAEPWPPAAVIHAAPAARPHPRAARRAVPRARP